jgi:hypothetical protein
MTQEYLPKAVIDAINSCLHDMATPIIGQERPLLVSYDSIRSRLKDMHEWRFICEDKVEHTYASQWVVTKVPGWGYCFTPKAGVRE